MRADATRLNALLIPRGSGQSLQIVSGQTAKLVAGEVMQAVVQKAEQTGSFKIILNGENFTVKGLPVSLAGREVSFVAQPGKGGAAMGLSWLGAAAEKGEQQSAKSPVQQQPVQKAQLSTLLSALPAGIKTGQVMTARIDAIEQNRMTMTLIANDSRPGQGSAAVKQQIITTPTMGLKAGQQVAINITGQTAAGKAIVEIIPQQQNHATAKAGKAEVVAGKLNMAVGDSALAVVQKRLSNGNIRINLKGMTLETPAPAQVKAGDALEIKLTKAPAGFQVVQLHQAVSQKAMTMVRQNLSTSHTPIAQNLTAIRNAVPNIDSGELANIKGLPQLESMLKATESSRDYPVNGERLAQIIRDSGSNLEAKLQALISKSDQPQSVQHDLKAILLQISGDQNTGKVHNTELLRLITELSQQSTSRIETGQALNVLANMQGEANRFEFPMLVGQQLINVQLAVQQHEQQQNRNDQPDNNEHAFNVLFALELSGLGKMKVDANISGNTVHARIYNDHAAARSFIQEHIGRLEERLLSLGFDKVYLMSTVQAPEPEKQQRFDELATMRPSSFSLLDVLV